MSRIIFIDGTRVEHVRRGLSRLCSKPETLDISADWHRTVAQAPARTTLLVPDPVSS